MEFVTVGEQGPKVSRIIMGCMQMGGSWDNRALTAEDEKRAAAMTDAALECGINLFDHADFYSCFKSDEVFGRLLSQRPSLRSKILIQSKCGIRPPFGENAPRFGQYDFSSVHILRSVEEILRRLRTDHLDFLLLHRPDPLMDPDEVASAFRTLKDSGKVLHFGVSNHTSLQMELLQKHLDVPLVVNQLRLNIVFSSLLNGGVDFQVSKSGDPLPATMTWDYCRLHGITVQAYGPQQHGFLVDRGEPKEMPEKAFAPNFVKAQTVIERIANEHQVPKEAVSLAWLLRLPHPVQPVIGTTRPERIRASCQALDLKLSRDEWYELYIAGRNETVP